MIINMQIVPEGHSTLTGTTNLESVKADLPTFLEEILIMQKSIGWGPMPMSMLLSREYLNCSVQDV